jgi:phospholipase/carboxylesterase
MMALHIGLRRPRAVASIVGYSGMLTSTADIKPEDLAKPPVLLVHGTADPVVPFAAQSMAENELNNLGVDVISHVSHGVPHTVDPVGLQRGQEFIASQFS